MQGQIVLRFFGDSFLCLIMYLLHYAQSRWGLHSLSSGYHHQSEVGMTILDTYSVSKFLMGLAGIYTLYIFITAKKTWVAYHRAN
jgi:hypothetical protein